jgi:hypothetical protein
VRARDLEIAAVRGSRAGIGAEQGTFGRSLALREPGPAAQLASEEAGPPPPLSLPY